MFLLRCQGCPARARGLPAQDLRHGLSAAVSSPRARVNQRCAAAAAVRRPVLPGAGANRRAIRVVRRTARAPRAWGEPDAHHPRKSLSSRPARAGVSHTGPAERASSPPVFPACGGEPYSSRATGCASQSSRAGRPKSGITVSRLTFLPRARVVRTKLAKCTRSSAILPCSGANCECGSTTASFLLSCPRRGEPVASTRFIRVPTCPIRTQG